MGKNKKIKKFLRQSKDEQTKKFNWKLALKLSVYFVIIFSVYQLALKAAVWLNEPIIQEITMIVYSSALTVVAVIFIILNKGVSRDIPTKEVLPQDWDDEKKEIFIDKYIRSKEKAKKLLLVLIPLILTLMIDMVYLFYFN